MNTWRYKVVKMSIDISLRGGLCRIPESIYEYTVQQILPHNPYHCISSSVVLRNGSFSVLHDTKKSIHRWSSLFPDPNVWDANYALLSATQASWLHDLSALSPETSKRGRKRRAICGHCPGAITHSNSALDRRVRIHYC